MPDGYGFKDNSGTYVPLQHTHLVDVTDNKVVEGSEDERAAVAREIKEKFGWYINMEQAGEKILNPSVTANNQVIFTSYQPGARGAVTLQRRPRV